MRDKKPQNLEIGKRIRARREEQNMTREQLAEAADVSVRFLTCVENGQSGISVDTLKKVAVALDISTDYLVLGRNRAKIPQDIADEIARIPESHQELLRRQIRLFHEIIKNS